MSTVAYVSMVKDEADIMAYQLRYYYKIGVRYFFIIDNGSTDGTVDIIKDFHDEVKDQAEVNLMIDDDVAYWQYIRINRLANIARMKGHKYILPVDADELLFQEGNPDFNINDYIAKTQPWDILKFNWWYFRATKGDNSSEVNPFIRMNHRDDPQQSSHTKIITRHKQAMEICQGNHKLHDEFGYKIFEPTDLFYAHFKYRSPEQFRKKIVNLGQAYEVIKDQFYHEDSILSYANYKKDGMKYVEEEFWKRSNEVKSVKAEIFTKEMFTL